MSNNGQEPAQDRPRSVLIIEFAAPGSAEFGMKTENVSPAQILAAAVWLDWYARHAFERIAQRSEANRIEVPGMAVNLNDLRAK